MRTFIYCTTALVALLSANTPANGEEDIVVTATRTPAAVANLPADVTLIDTEESSLRGQFTLDQALAEVPGIQAPRTGPIGQQTSIFSGGFESNHTLVLFDGVRLDDPSTPEGVFDAGSDTLGAATRIEVVQGPLSALYGSNALGGVVNLLSRRGSPGALNARMDVAAGSFATVLANVGADGTLGRFRYALTAEAYSSDGYDIVPERVATFTGEPDGANITTLTGAFDFALTEKIAIDALVRRRDANASYDPGLFGNIDENPQSEVRQNESALWRLGASWRPTDALVLRLSGGALATDRVFTDFGVIGDEFHGERAFADIGAEWGVGAWALSFGGTNEDERIDAVSFGSDVSGAQSHWGLYAGAQGPLGPLDVTGAVRHDDFEGFGGETTWRLGASYPLAQAARIYGAYGVGYRAPSLYELRVPFFGVPTLQPERSETWELGADAHFALFGQADGVELGALYRSSSIDDLIGFLGFTYANVDRADIDFAELRASVRPTEWLTLGAAYANTNARDSNRGEALVRRPRHAWSADIKAERGPYAAQISWREIGSRLDTTYDDLGVFAGTGAVESYSVVRASASWAVREQVRLYVSADNVLDETYEPVNGFAGAPASVLFGVRVTP